jgi:hypothetical protein
MQKLVATWAKNHGGLGAVIGVVKLKAPIGIAALVAHVSVSDYHLGPLFFGTVIG